MNKTLIRLSFIALVIYGCQKSTEDEQRNESITGSISADDASSTPAALAAFKMPASDDYAAIPQDPKNPITAEKVELGKLLFHDSRMSSASLAHRGRSTYSCATCHHAEAGFQSGMAQAIGEGGLGFGVAGEGRYADPSYIIDAIDIAPIRTPSVLNVAYSEVLMWSGQFGGTGINIGTEANWTPGTPRYNNFLGYQGTETTGLSASSRHRLSVDEEYLSSIPEYKNLFDLAFPDLPESERISNLTASLAMGAYQRTLLPNQSPFQLWLRGDKRAMNKDMTDGKTLFFGKAKCASCHSTPGLGAATFYSLGMNDLANGVGGAANVDPKAVEHRGRGGFTGLQKDMYQFKTPQLYNLKDVSYFGHGSSFTSLLDVVHYINNAVPQNGNVPATRIANQFKPLYLTEDEINKLVTFIRDGLYDPNLSRYVPSSVPSGSCIPNNDEQSRTDRGCN